MDLHNGLKELATGKGLGKPAVINLQSKVTAVDTDAPSITLASGEVIHGDLVIGADGVHVSRSTTADSNSICIYK